MWAVRFHRFGDPAVLRLEQVRDPRDPVGDEVLVQVDASSINGTDLGLRRGDLKIATLGRLPFIPGFDLSGTVLRCGPAVTAFTPGDRVMALLGHGGGGQAQRVLLRQHRAARVPVSCAAVQAAALPLAGLTALQALHGKAGLHTRPAGTRVLVVGASGGIGSYAVQLAKVAGAHVTATASGSKLAFVASLGADELVDHTTQDVTAVGGRWDVVLDSPGRLTFAAVQRVLSPGGVMVSTRAVGADTLRAMTMTTRTSSRSRFAAVMTRARSIDLAHLAHLTDIGRLRPAVDKVFPAAQASAAHAYAETCARGKVVVTFQG